jgi:hypothetical protein
MKKVPKWTTARARLHSLQETAYRGQNPWTGSPLQVFLLVEKDFLYNARAFHHVVPSTTLSPEEAQYSMAESWRLGPEQRDLSFFECKHCRQFSKHGFCSQVLAIHPMPTFITLRHCFFNTNYRSPASDSPSNPNTTHASSNNV